MTTVWRNSFNVLYAEWRFWREIRTIGCISVICLHDNRNWIRCHKNIFEFWFQRGFSKVWENVARLGGLPHSWAVFILILQEIFTLGGWTWFGWVWIQFDDFCVNALKTHLFIITGSKKCPLTCLHHWLAIVVYQRVDNRELVTPYLW